MALCQEILLLTFVFVLRTALSAPDAYCVKSEEVSRCSVSGYQCTQCYPLMWYTENHTIVQNFSNSVLYFLKGSHELAGRLNISSVTNFSLKGAGPSAAQSRINCTHSEGGILFFNSTNVTMTNIAISFCGIDMNYSTKNFSVHAAVSFNYSTNVVLLGVVISDSEGLGLHVDRVDGQIHVQNSTFMYSKGSVQQRFVANARFYYSRDSAENSTLLIKNCSFLHGYSNRTNDLDKPDSSGLLILIYAPSIQVTIKNITAEYNHAVRGGNVGILITYFHENMSTVSISNSNISYGRAEKRGGGLIYFIWLNQRWHSNPDSYLKKSTHTIFSISHVHFFNNSAKSGGAAYIHQQQLGSIDCTLQRISFTNCVFEHNTGVRGIAVAIIKFLVPNIWVSNSVLVQYDVTFQQCKFSKNKHVAGAKQNCKASVMMLLQADSVSITSSNFTYNSGIAISLVNSNLIFKGSILFKRNTAIHGGALNLCDSSLIYLSPHTYVKLVENEAKVSGGAIFAEQRRLDSDPPCFYQPLVNMSLSESEMKEQVQFEYINNSAGIAGSAIYGGSVDNCYSIRRFHLINFTDLFDVLHNLTQQPGPSDVTSDPINIVLCKPDACEMANERRTIHVFSGEIFSLSVSAVGQRNGLVPAFINISLPKNKPALTTLKTLRWEYDRCHICHSVYLAVSSNLSSVTLEFSLKYSSTASWSDATSSPPKPPKVTVNIRDYCPWIFKRNEVTKSCECASIISDEVTCNITNQSFKMRDKKNVWVGFQYNNNSFTNESACDQVLLSDNCPKEFCNTTDEWLSQENASKQCQDGRDGIHCGRCRNGYSLTLGSQDCVSNDQCPLWRLPILLLAFVIVGLLLVLFLTVFNFTVSQGTLYGLLFYANVVHVNHKTLLENCSNSIRIFIAWLNLDFGFKTCLYVGMDAYQKVWLEFAFILYLLSIAVLIVFLSHKFICVTRLVGRNVINVLSTILFLCFIKTARAAIKVLHYFDLKTCFQNCDKVYNLRVWYYDGNITYFQGKHIPLALVSIVLITIVSLYMFSLLFIQCLQRGSGWCVLRWVNKLRPFFDAYTGPCRDQFRFWPGVLLFCLFTMFILHVPVNINAEKQLYL